MATRERFILGSSAAAALLMLAFFSPPVQAIGSGFSPAGAQALPWKERPVKFRLSCGLSGLYQKDTASATTVVQIFISGGKGDVPPGKDGLAYLVTRLAVEIPDADTANTIISHATRMKVAVHEDYSLISLECLSDNVENAVKLASELVQGRILSGLRIDHNKETMLLLGRAGEDDAVATGHNATLKAFFQGQGYGSAEYGTEESLKGLTKKDIVAFDRRHFAKGGLLFTVCSDLDQEKIIKLLEQHFAGLPEGEAAGMPTVASASWPNDRKIVLAKDTKQSYVARVFLCPYPPATPGIFAKACLAETLLGKGPGSRLWALRASNELAYSVNARLTWTKSCGVLESYLETENSKRDRAVESLDKILRTFFEQGVKTDELEMAKTLARAQFLRANETKEARSLSLGTLEILGLGVDYFSGIFDALNAVTLDDMNAFIKTVFPPETSLLVIVGGGAGSNLS
jgi:predicted Zn-dependent peptidase